MNEEREVTGTDPPRVTSIPGKSELDLGLAGGSNFMRSRAMKQQRAASADPHFDQLLSELRDSLLAEIREEIRQSRDKILREIKRSRRKNKPPRFGYFKTKFYWDGRSKTINGKYRLPAIEHLWENKMTTEDDFIEAVYGPESEPSPDSIKSLIGSINEYFDDLPCPITVRRHEGFVILEKPDHS